MDENTAPIRDAETLRAFAHPMRLRLYEVLMARGPSTASRLARDVPAAPGSLSYHLRQLAKHGFVREASELTSDRRERVWRAVPGGAHWEERDLEASEGLREAAISTQLVFLARQQRLLVRWYRDEIRDADPDWRSSALATDALLHLDAHELSEFRDEVDGVVERWIEVSRANRNLSVKPSEEDTDKLAMEPKKEVMVVMHAFPLAFVDDDLGEPMTDGQSP